MATQGLDEIVRQAINSQFQGGQPAWTLTCMLALGLSVSIAAIAWMISEFLKSGALKNWAKEEINQVIYSAVLIGLLFPLLVIINAMSIVLFGSDYFSVGTAYLTSLSLSMQSTMAYIISLKMLFEALGSIHIPFALIAAGIAAIFAIPTGGTSLASIAIALLTNASIDYFGPIKGSVGPLDILLKAMTPALFATLAQRQLLVFFQKTMLTFILPIGLVMRAFTLTRRAGSTLIAVAIVGAVVYPLSVAYMGPVYDSTAAEYKVDMITFPQLIGNITQESPTVGTYYVNKSTDYFQWNINAEDYTYRVWFLIPTGIGASKCDDTLNVWNSDETSSGKFQPPPLDGGCGDSKQNPCGVWQQHRSMMTIDDKGIKHTTDVYRCFQFADKESGSFGEGAIFYLDDPVLVRIDDVETEIMIDAYSNVTETPIPMGYLSTRVYVGDPCKEDTFTKIACKFGKTYAGKPSASLTTDKAIGALANGAFNALGDTFVSVGNAIKRSGFKSLLTPTLAAMLYLEVTDRLPSVAYPILLTTITLLFSYIVSNTAFKAISAVLGGEGEITELSRLV